jgi:hypothetical protein
MHSAYTLEIVNISTLLNIVFVTLYRESYLSAPSNTDLATISTCGWLKHPCCCHLSARGDALFLKIRLQL